MLQECKCGWGDTNLHFFPPKMYSNYALHVFKGDDETFTLLYNDKEQGGSGF